MNDLYIGITGLARSGKDTFGEITYNILQQNEYECKKYSFANQLKSEVADFLKTQCEVDVWTNDFELKTDIRDFLVWYGTTFWRKRNPDKWVQKVKNDILLYNKSSIHTKRLVNIITDVRYLNEADFIHSNNGYLIHISKYNFDTTGPIPIRKFQQPPNEQERINDPILQQKSDRKVVWQDVSEIAGKKLTSNEIVNHFYLVNHVKTILKSLEIIK